MSILFDAFNDAPIPTKTKTKVLNPLVAVCVPAKDQMHTQFAYALTQMLLYSQSVGIKTHLFFSLGTLIVNQRESLVTDAIKINATHILWLDSDMTFPKDTIERLLSHNAQVVAANYAQRRSPIKSVAFEKATDWESYLVHSSNEAPTYESTWLKGLIEVEAVGMGCMLEDISIYDALKRPFFQLIWDERAQDHHGEDMFHCARLVEKGIPILIDADISREITHCGDFNYKLEMVTYPPQYY